MKDKKKKVGFLVFGETLDTEEKLGRASRKVDSILDEYRGVSFQEALSGYLRGRKLEASDIRALRLYLIKNYFPAQYPTSLKKIPEWKRHLIYTALDSRRFMSTEKKTKP